MITQGFCIAAIIIALVLGFAAGKSSQTVNITAIKRREFTKGLIRGRNESRQQLDDMIRTNNRLQNQLRMVTERE